MSAPSRRPENDARDGGWNHQHDLDDAGFAGGMGENKSVPMWVQIPLAFVVAAFGAWLWFAPSSEGIKTLKKVWRLYVRRDK